MNVRIGILKVGVLNIQANRNILNIAEKSIPLPPPIGDFVSSLFSHLHLVLAVHCCKMHMPPSFFVMVNFASLILIHDTKLWLTERHYYIIFSVKFFWVFLVGIFIIFQQCTGCIKKVDHFKFK